MKNHLSIWIVTLAILTVSSSALALEAGIGCDCENEPAKPSELHERTLAMESSNDTNQRIQTGVWSVPKENIADAIGPVVRLQKLVNGVVASSTGFLVDNCRVWTQIHGILGMKYGVETGVLKPGDTLDGMEVEMEIGPTNSAGKRVKRTVIVERYGRPIHDDPVLDSDEEWAVLKDPSCSSKEYGYIRIQPGQNFKRLSRLSFMVPGFSYVPHAGADGETLYIDTNCQLTNRAYPGEGYYLTNCSVGPQGSGSPLVIPYTDESGKIVLENGHPVYAGYGWVLTKENNRARVDVPGHSNTPAGIAPFSRELYDRVKDLLEGSDEGNQLARATNR